MNESGFTEAKLVQETGFNCSSVTKGVLFRARKTEMVQERLKPMTNPMERYEEFFSMVYQPGALDVKTKHLIALGVSLGAGCQP